MNWKIDEGWLTGEGVRRCPSPNCDQRPQDTEVSLLVIHNISLPPGKFGSQQMSASCSYIDAFFTNRLDKSADSYFEDIADMEVSSHFLIDRLGEITQYVSLNDRAWHCGESCFQGRPRCNDYSIGIELEGADDVPYEDVQYMRLQALTACLQRAYPALKQDSIVGHCHIAPDRKTDPGECFDWNRYRDSIAK